MPKFPKIWAFARRISCVYTHGMQRAGAWHANGAVMDNHHRHAASKLHSLPLSPHNNNSGQKKSPPPPYSALLYRAKMPKFPKIWAFARRISCVYTHGMPRAGVACKRRGDGHITATPPATRHTSPATLSISRAYNIPPDI